MKRTIVAAFICLILPCVSLANDSKIIGVGNGSCVDWKKATPTEKTEILSWMVGYASALNLERTFRHEAGWRMDLLTYDSLNTNIMKQCLANENQQTPMTLMGVLLKILVDFPTVK